MPRPFVLSAACLFSFAMSALAADPCRPVGGNGLHVYGRQPVHCVAVIPTQPKAACCRPVVVHCRPAPVCCVPQATCAAPSACAPAQAGPVWKRLFDGKTLDGWELSNFGGEGDVTVEDGAVVLEMGADLTGIHTERPLPKVDYEVSLEARRVEGSDFFCGLTVPVRESHCSLIVGGWGGGVCGLSSINGYDASENDTTTYRTFETGQWYRIRLRVTGPRIQAWIDDERIVNQSIKEKEISIRPEVDPSLPFGIAAWRTTAALRDIRIRELSADEIAQDATAAAEEHDEETSTLHGAFGEEDFMLRWDRIYSFRLMGTRWPAARARDIRLAAPRGGRCVGVFPCSRRGLKCDPAPREPVISLPHS